MSADTLLALMVALIFSSGLLFVAYMRLDGGRSRPGADADAGARRRGRAIVLGVGLAVGALFLAAALFVVGSLVGG